MINLLPSDEKKQIIARKTNVLLWRYSIFSLILAGLLFTIIAGVYILMMHSKGVAEETIRSSQAKSAEYRKVQQEITEFNTNLTTAKTILDKEIKYSKVAVRIAQAIPRGVVLESLNLDADTFGQPMTLRAIGRNYQDAINLKTSFERSEYFDEVQLVSVNKVDVKGKPKAMNITIDVIIKPEIMK
ncbi:hypothetical protein CR969_00435 [Candidatus Saccharibacteria bacterium]|nr:MAG: hypothetical protein CR969_00435 [Candidatus Saccharibacteria bacterium]